MKRTLVCCFLGLLAAVQSPAQTQVAQPRLTGIISLPDYQRALLEITPDGGTQVNCLLLDRRQRQGAVQVLDIQPAARTVKIRVSSEERTLTLSHPLTAAPAGIVLDAAWLDPVVMIYAELSKRLVLRSPRLPAVRLDLDAPAGDTAQALPLLTAALAKRGIAAIPDGSKFVLLVPAIEAAMTKPRSDQIKPNTKSELIPAGTVNFPGTDLGQVLQIYAELIGRKLDRRAPLPPTSSGLVRFSNRIPVTREELVYALDTLFAWQGLKVVEADPGFVKPVPLHEGDR